MSNQLTVDELDELIRLSDISFNFYDNSYCTNLLTLNINQATAWLNKQSYHPKKQLDKFIKLSRWVVLAEKYKKTIQLFYPVNVFRTNTFVNELKESEYLITNNQQSLINYWTAKLNSLDYTNLTTQSLINYGRICLSLNIEIQDDSFRFKEFVKVFDLEVLYGYSIGTVDTFFILFSYLKAASDNNHWSYTKYEWPLLKSSLSLWQTWLICSSTKQEIVTYLLRKYCQITNINSAFIYWIWDNPVRNLELNSKWYEETQTDYIQVDSSVEEAFKVIGLNPDVSFSEARLVYKNLIKQYHPDLNSTGLIQAQQINNAWTQIKQHYNKGENL